MIQDVAIIGLGIVGQVALEELAHSDLKVVVIDEIETTSDLHFLRDVDGYQSTWIRGSRVSGFPGGRLNWGKNCSLVTIEDYPPLGEELQPELARLSKRLTKYGFPNLRPVQLRKVEEGKFYVRESMDFQANNWISRMRSSEQIHLISGLATEVNQVPGGLVKIVIRKSDDSTQEIYARKVIICAGPFGTQELLANSGLLPVISPRIWDHVSFVLQDIPLTKVKLAKFGLFGWNRIRKINIKRCNTFYDESKNILWTLRLFPEGVLNLDMALARIKRDFRSANYRSCLSLATGMAGSFFTGRILHERIQVHISADFLNDSDSLRYASYGEGERIDFLEYERSSISISREFYKFISKTIENLRLDLKTEFRLESREEVALTEVISSSHHMGTVSKSGSNREQSPLEITQNIFAAGSSIFQSSVPGHPTLLAAATAILAADQVKSQLS